MSLNPTDLLSVAGNRTPTVGVLALQGDYQEHLAIVTTLGVSARSVRRREDLDAVEGLIIPGGESTVIDKLSRTFGLAEPLRTAIRNGFPVFGTCAGLIMLADRIVDGAAGQQSFGGLDISVRRNAFGHQNDSFESDLDIDVISGSSMHAVFIRAPIVEAIGDGPTVVARLDDGRIVAVEHGNLIGTSFHPELTGDRRLHEYFIDKVRAAEFRE